MTDVFKKIDSFKKKPFENWFGTPASEETATKAKEFAEFFIKHGFECDAFPGDDGEVQFSIYTKYATVDFTFETDGRIETYVTEEDEE